MDRAIAVLVSHVCVCAACGDIKKFVRSYCKVRLEAVELSQKRLKTLSDRNRFYRAVADTSARAAAAAAVAEGFAATGLTWASSRSDDAGDSRKPSLDGDPRIQPITRGSTGGSGTGTGTLSLLAAAANVLLNRRHGGAAATAAAAAAKTFPTSSSSSPGATSGVVSAAATTNLSASSSRNNSSTLNAPWTDRAPDSRRSLNGQQHHHHHRFQQPQHQLGGASDGSGGSGPLQRNSSDSRLVTGHVLGSVPPDTIISTRQVLAAFNYDYSALHRRESSYLDSDRETGGGDNEQCCSDSCRLGGAVAETQCIGRCFGCM
ncbi:hypothetical protein VOLCADRAFT_90859 [Volvox carteri f. nagariensis]|uniref:Uncharacterized protein n=1 Tax=Volvox carteri f. nagariensis TaxID=3068 RepID=D8TV90_VOLCA|nr:uncharacterized protein VOLCADRAFT_90859 [Volvox carteri f. nagariensis]EFJ48535.1 hypothetical protein VOLCADRAFT_90859 [Volvox carteri f. nagariensis]|eukprot:XP_002950334.1 hypothetical protein VOLCADRAFT_90859 [Volvox carteri f. nagariensis]